MEQLNLNANDNIKANKEDNIKKWTIFIIILSATFMGTLDGSIVNVALPNMAEVLGVTTSQIQYVVTSYLIVISGVILIFGRLGDMFGKTKVFKVGLLLFTIGSLLCGITRSFSVLILARVVQAIGAAGTIATNQGIITEIFPKNERGKALGLNGTAVALGSLVGPGLGGFIVGASSWEYIFLINVPIGIIALFFAVKLLPKSNSKNNEKIDIFGAALFIITIVPLFVSLNEGINLGFSSPIIIGGFVIAVAAFIGFIALERKIKAPLIELQMFKDKLFSLSIFCGFISFVAIFCHNIILPFYLQNVMSYSPQKAGMMLMIYPLVLMVVAPVSGSLSDRMGSEFLTFIGLTLASLGLFLMALLNENSSVLSMGIFIAIMSCGMGLFQSPNNSLIMSTVPMNKLGIAGSINALVRNIGMVSGIALATTLLYTQMSNKIGYRVTSYVAGRNDAFIYGMRWVYITAGAISLLGAILTAFRMYSRKKNKE